MPFYTQTKTNSFAPQQQQPPNPWVTQPKATSSANAFQLPQGFDVGQGSLDPAINRQVYGSNYFPGSLPNYQGITTQEQFTALDPQQQAGYRNALYNQNQLNQYLGPQNYGGDFTQNPAYQSRLKESERALNRQLLSTGRSDSTGGLNAFATNARRLAGEFEQENYNRGFQENESMYGRQFAIRQYLDQLGMTQDDINYKRAYDLMMAGFQPGPQ